MSRIRLFFAALTTASLLVLALAAGAQAEMYFVNPHGEVPASDANPCTSPEAPCVTIHRALERIAAHPEPSTIAVGSGTFNEDVELTKADDGLTIIGIAPTHTTIKGTVLGKPAFSLAAGTSAALADLTVTQSSADTTPAVRYGGQLTLVETNVEGAGSGNEDAIQAAEGAGPLELFASHVNLAGTATGAALDTKGSVTIKGSYVYTLGEGATGLRSAGPANVEGSSFTSEGKEAVNVTGALTAGGESPQIRLLVDRLETTGAQSSDYASSKSSLYAYGSRFATRGFDSTAVSQEGGTLTLEHSEPVTEGPATPPKIEGVAHPAPSTAPRNRSVGIYAAETAQVHLTESRVLMYPGGNIGAGIETRGSGPVELANSTISGIWSGPAAQIGASWLHTFATNFLLPPSDPAPALSDGADAPGAIGLWVQRSTIRAGAGAPAALEFEPLRGGAVVDSSLLVGGRAALLVTPQPQAQPSQTVVAASTLDAGNAGTPFEPVVHSIALHVAGAGARASASVVGSVLFQPSEAALEAGGAEAAVACSYSEAPGQLQSASGGSGSIACSSRRHHDHAFGWPGAIFASPFSTFRLRQGTRAVNSVPFRAIHLPGGLHPSAVDLTGRPRWVKSELERRCMLVLDRGAQQIRGQRGYCPRRRRPRPRRRR